MEFKASKLVLKNLAHFSVVWVLARFVLDGRANSPHQLSPDQLTKISDTFAFLTDMKFTKMHGAGNDYIYVDCFSNPTPESPGSLSEAISHRRFGIGADGLILIEPTDVADARMRMFNADGSESEMCGNGIRCLAKYVYEHGIVTRPELKIETGAGILAIDLEVAADEVQSVTVDMGVPQLEPAQIPTTLGTQPVVNQAIEFAGHTLNVTCVSMGNPHCIAFVPAASDELVLGLGPKIENDPRFPARTNVEFVEVISPREYRQRTWERGSGETWACGTGASAVCVAGALAQVGEREVLIHLLGGDLKLRWDQETNHVFMTGPAVEVFSGEWPT